MTLAALWAFLAVALPVLASLLANLPTVDLAYHLRAGDMLLETGRVSTKDTFTYTVAGQPWVNQQWGAQLVFAAVYRAGGWSALVVLRAVVVAIVFGTIFLACRRQGVTARSAALLTLGAFLLSAVALALRPQLIGMALFALVVLLIVERRRNPRILWAAPVLVVLWSNVHGSFFLGPLVLGLAWLVDLHDGVPDRHRALVVAVAATVAASINPFGPSVWVYAAGLSTNPEVTARITEWQPTSLRTVPGAAFFASALLVAAVLARRGRATPWPALLWFAVFFAIGAYAVRGLAWWPLAAAMGMAGLVVGGFLGSRIPAPALRDSGRVEAERGQATTRRPRARLANAALAAGLVAAGIALLPQWRPHDPRVGAPAGVVGTAPPGITGKLREIARPTDRLWNPQPWSSWFEFALPAVRVPVDSRFELFPPDVWDDYDAVAAGRAGWQEILDRWQVTLLVVTEGREAGLLAELRQGSAWTLVHEDVDGYLFVRSGRDSS